MRLEVRPGLAARPPRVHQPSRHALRRTAMGGGGGGKSSNESSGSSHSTTQVILPPWVDKAGQENVAEAGRIAAPPYQENEGTLIPEFSQMTADTLDYMLSNVGTYQDMYDEAGNATRALQARGD